MTLGPSLELVDRSSVLYRGRKLSYFSGCDYYRLSMHPAVLRAFRNGAKELGLNVAASRVTTGNHPIYLQLEQRLCEYFEVPSAVLLSSGYAANIALAQALAGCFSHALIDARAHASLGDAARWLACPIWQFKHKDPADLRRILARLRRARPILLTDGMFAHDGSIAPLAEYLEVLPKSGRVWVDDAHAAGVLGANGRGTIEHCGVRHDRFVQTITLSKAFGAYGGAVLATREVSRKIVARSPLFAGNTPVPPPLAKGALAAIDILDAGERLRHRLQRNVRYVKRALLANGYPAPDNSSPIIPLTPVSREQIAAITKALLAARIYPPLIRYPGGPSLGYFRFALSSEHTREQLSVLRELLCRIQQAGERKL